MDMSPGVAGGQGAEGAVDMSPGDKRPGRGRAGAEGAVDMSPGDRRPGRGQIGGWETEDLAGGRQGAEGAVDIDREALGGLDREDPAREGCRPSQSHRFCITRFRIT